MMIDEIQTTRVREMVHVRFNGRSFDLPVEALRLPDGAGEGDVKRLLARHLEIPVEQLDGYVIERHETGNWTIRPEAVFG
jgi:hypothetical protein